MEAPGALVRRWTPMMEREKIVGHSFKPSDLPKKIWPGKRRLVKGHGPTLVGPRWLVWTIKGKHAPSPVCFECFGGKLLGEFDMFGSCKSDKEPATLWGGGQVPPGAGLYGKVRGLESGDPQRGGSGPLSPPSPLQKKLGEYSFPPLRPP